MEKDEESVSLMHGEDLDSDLDLDLGNSPRPSPPPSPKKKNKKKLKKLIKKRTREDDEDDDSDEAKSKPKKQRKDGSSHDESVESSASKLLRPMFLDHEKERARGEAESDAFFKKILDSENKLNGTDSDLEEKQPAGDSNMAMAEPMARLQNVLFGNEDDEMLKGDPEDNTTASANKKKKNDTDKDGDVEMREAEAPDEVFTVVFSDDRIPIESKGLDIGIVRCTYAANPVIEGWSPFSLETSNNTIDGVPVDENAIMTMPWGVYCLHTSSGDGGEGKSSRRRRLEFATDSVTRKLSGAPWFILMASEQILRYMASPFFTYKVRALPVDSTRIKFSWRHEVPIFYVMGLDEKTPLWPVDSVWQPAQLQRMFVDTLYAHLEKTGRTKGHDLEDKVKKVLSTIAEFPLPISKPADTLLPPGDVAMNNYSLRAERTEHVKTIMTNLFKASTSPAIVTPMQARCADATPLSQVASRYLTSADYIFLDLEKPYHIWQRYVVDGGLPLDVVSRVSYWAKHKTDDVVARFTQLEVFVERFKDTERVLFMRDFIKLREFVSFSPDWFDGWFRHVRQSSNREERKNVYAFFAACELWRQTQEDAERYGSVSTYLFTKARREFLFERDFICRDANYAHILRVTKEKSTGIPFESLMPAETQDIMRQIVDFLTAFNTSYLTAPYRIQTDDTGSLTSTSAIQSDRYETSDLLAKFIMLVALQWKNCYTKLEPRGLRSLSPLVVQCATVYGHKSGNHPDDFYADVQKALGGSLVMLIVRPYSSKSELAKFLKNECESRKFVANPPHVIVFDRFHDWPLDIIASCLHNLKQFKLDARCTNLIVTGFAHSMGCVNGGGSMIWELLEVADRLDNELYMSLKGAKNIDNPNGGGKTAASILFDKQASRWRSSVKGLLSEQHYSMDERDEQLLANEALFVSRKTSNLEKICQQLVHALDKKKCTTVAVLFARYTTSKRIYAEIQKLNATLLSVVPVPIQLFNYRDIEQKPALLANRDIIVLADIDYKGGNRPSYLHINAVFEHARSGVLVISDKLATDEEHPVEILKDVFHRSDEKSDRYLMTVGRCPIVKERFERLISVPKVISILRASTTILPKQEQPLKKSD